MRWELPCRPLISTSQHEWGHIMSNRLVGNGVGLSNNQGGSMGEGWSDFYALSMLNTGN